MTKRDELIALGGVGAKVRELEWVEMPDRDPESASWIAETDLGRSYRVFAAWWGAQNKYGYVFDGFYHTENEAKAAAQADYERRVLSALEAPAAGDGEPVADWRADPTSDEHWNAGCDFAMEQLCKALGVDPATVNWDAATETVDGDVQSVIWNILRTRMGEDWSPDTASPAEAAMRWRHKKRGSTYTEVGIGRMQAASWVDLNNDNEHKVDMREVAIYRADSDGTLWVRPREEIEGGRFEALTAPGATTKSDGGEQPPRVGIDWQLSDDAKARIAEIDAAIVRPGDSRLNQIIGGPSPVPFSNYGEYTPVTVRGSTSDPSSTRSEVTALVDREWQSLLDKDDRTSPEEYSDMCLITREELHGIVNTALLETHEIRRK